MKNISNISRTFGALLVTSVLATGALAAIASADSGDTLQGRFSEALASGDTETAQEMYNQCMGGQDGKAFHHGQPEDWQEMQDILDTGDYRTWYDYMSQKDTPMADDLLEKITADNFSTFLELHQARQDHDIETAKELMEELDLEGPRGPMHGMRWDSDIEQ